MTFKPNQSLQNFQIVHASHTKIVVWNKKSECMCQLQGKKTAFAVKLNLKGNQLERNIIPLSMNHPCRHYPNFSHTHRMPQQCACTVRFLYFYIRASIYAFPQLGNIHTLLINSILGFSCLGFSCHSTIARSSHMCQPLTCIYIILTIRVL